MEISSAVVTRSISLRPPIHATIDRTIWPRNPNRNVCGVVFASIWPDDGASRQSAGLLARPVNRCVYGVPGKIVPSAVYILHMFNDTMKLNDADKLVQIQYLHSNHR